MPLVEVYQMPFGLRTCLPRGCVPASVGSQAVTINSFGPDGLSASVMSKLKASYPPRCWPISLPFTQTLASKSTAPKCSSNRWPFHLWGTSNVRRYQMRSFSLTGRITPDNADSTGNGTRICVWNVARVASLLVMAKSHKPLRLSQSRRTIWGRGYSGWAFSGETSLAHRVFSGPAAGCQVAAHAGEADRNLRDRKMNCGTSLRGIRAMGRRQMPIFIFSFRMYCVFILYLQFSCPSASVP